MRILQLAPPWFPVPPTGYGGIEHVVATLTDGLVAAGHDVTLLASGGSRTSARLRSLYQTPPSPLLGDVFTELPHVLEGYLNRHEFDLIHDHTGLGAGLAAVADGPPVVHTLHGPWTPASEELYRRICRRVSLVAISHDQAARAPRDVELAGVVHNGVPIERYPVGDGSGGYLAFVGRASHEKGPEIAIEVAHRLGMPLRMAIKINERAEQRYWEEVVAPRLGDADVRLLPHATHEQKVALLGGAAAVLFPIDWAEPFGLVMAEANAVGTPVVAFALGAAREVLADGDTGILVDPGDVDAFTAAVPRAMRLDRSACRAHVVRNLSAQRMVDGYLDLYARLHAPTVTTIPDTTRTG